MRNPCSITPSKVERAERSGHGPLGHGHAHGGADLISSEIVEGVPRCVELSRQAVRRALKHAKSAGFPSARSMLKQACVTDVAPLEDS